MILSDSGGLRRRASHVAAAHRHGPRHARHVSAVVRAVVSAVVVVVVVARAVVHLGRRCHLAHLPHLRRAARILAEVLGCEPVPHASHLSATMPCTERDLSMR